MYLDILVLSRLRQGAAHGYELRRRIEATTSFAMHNNSLYPALRRFEEAGAVERTTEPQDGRPPRHVYRITPAGTRLLHDMAADLPDDLAGNEGEFLVRLSLFDDLAPHERARVIAARDRAVELRLRRLEEIDGHAAGAGSPWGRLVAREMLARAERERGWLAELARRAAALDPPSERTP
ncbi:PadR family transcriptional regulator [Actinomadura gamaensis]|uniref:PadR family transcriptional regulator n=1 Tax=Actinomadura gamaensis TaxID=1763541 RepID=A0ABV9U5Y2_9ACTN